MSAGDPEHPYRSCSQCETLKRALLASKEDLESEARARSLENEAAGELIKKLQTERDKAQVSEFAKWVSKNGFGLVAGAAFLAAVAFLIVWGVKSHISKYTPPTGPCHDSAEIITGQSPPYICLIDASIATEVVGSGVLVRCTCPAPAARPR